MKKRFITIIIAILAIIIISISAYAETNIDASRMGDVNGDNKVTAGDARLVLRVAAHLDTKTKDIAMYGDINKDGEITASDARTVLRVAANLEDINCIISGHNMVKKVVSPTCTNEGYTTNKCSRCSYADGTKINVTSKIAHNYKLDNSVKATCKSEGYDLYKCTVCDTTKKDNVQSKTAHLFKKGSVVKGTCISDGYTEYKCSVCGAVEKRDVTKAGGHKYKIVKKEFYSNAGDNSIYKTQKKCEHCKNTINTYETNSNNEMQVVVKPLTSAKAKDILKKYNLSEKLYYFEGYDFTNSTVVVYTGFEGVDINGYYYNPDGKKMGNHDYCGKPLGIGNNMCNGFCNITWS